ncbi:MAG: ion transporter [Pseudomonadota bacterium]
MKETLRKRTFHSLEGGFEGSGYSRMTSGFIVVLIVLNVLAVIAESHEPWGSQYKTEFFIFNLVSVAIFTIEYVLRVWVCVESEDKADGQHTSSRLKYMLSPVAIIDLIAIAPFYLSFLFAIDLRYLRMLRMLRLLKLTHYFKGLGLFIDVLKKELSSIAAAIFIMLVLVLLSASLMYSVENNAQPDVFDSIPSAVWWSVVTMTTVGYGDVIPVTALGKLIAIFIMLLGVGFVALPAAMLAAKFGDELRFRKKQLEHQVEIALADGVITSEELHSLRQLTDKLELPEDTINQLLRSRNRNMNCISVCPKCGHEFSVDEKIKIVVDSNDE